MLNITVQNSSEGAKSYFAKSDYYAEGQQEITGDWGGRGAVMLGLFGKVDKTRFDQLCDNINPQSGAQLTAISRDGRRTGYDFTWSAPKSTSVVHAMTGDERIVTAFRESVRETMAELEVEMQARVRKGGVDSDRTTGNLTWAEFVHLTSRPVNGVPCPQLHSHVFCFATYDRAESMWKAGQYGKIKSSSYYWQAAQQAQFANALQKLGYSIHKTKDAFEIDGIPKPLLDKFSLRTRQIEAKAKEIAEQRGLDVLPAKVKAKLGATTREAKDTTIPYQDLVALWDGQLTVEERSAVRGARGMPITVEPTDRAEVAHAIKHAFERSSVVAERRLLTAALRRGIGGVTPEGVRREFDKAELLTREENGIRWVTTKEMLAEETRMIGFASGGRGYCRPIAEDAKRVKAYLAGTELSDEQAMAVSAILTAPDRLVILRGISGTGKTTLTRHAVRLIEEAGKNVAMMAPSAQASRGVLRAEGFAGADTLAQFLIDTGAQERVRDGVIWCDESGLIGTRTMGALFDVAAKNNARVVLVGDKYQLSSVEHGDALRILEELGGIKAACVTDIRRQSGEYREAVKLLSRGYTGAGLDKLDAMGCVKLLPVWNSYEPVAKEYVQHVKRAKPKDKDTAAVIVCPTHFEGASVTAAVRAELKAQGLVGQTDVEFLQLVPTHWTEAERADIRQYSGEEILQFHRNTGRYKAGERVRAAEALSDTQLINRAANFSVYTEGTINLAAGDMIRLTGNGYSKDRRQRINNGSFYRIKGFTKSGDIRLENNRVIDREFGQIALGYVSTAQAAQGRTVAHAIIVQSAISSPASNTAGFYVGVSRGRMGVSIWTDSKHELRDAIGQSSTRRSATELMVRPDWWERMRMTMARVRTGAELAVKAVARQMTVPQREVSHAR